jgi:hypothetical protein
MCTIPHTALPQNADFLICLDPQSCGSLQYATYHQYEAQSLMPKPRLCSSLEFALMPADKLLAPVVQSAVLHPTLGCVAVQRAPPLALRQAANIMQVGSGCSSPYLLPHLPGVGVCMVSWLNLASRAAGISTPAYPTPLRHQTSSSKGFWMRTSIVNCTGWTLASFPALHTPVRSFAGH